MKTAVIKGPGTSDMFRKVLAALVGPDIKTQTVLDLCCNEAPFTSELLSAESTFVDVQDRWPFPGRRGSFVQTDVLAEHPCFDKHYDISLCLDGIEHLTRADGFSLLDRMLVLSDKQILFTPIGHYYVDGEAGSYDAHNSGWCPEDFPDFAAIVAPDFHALATPGQGAFWVWKCPSLDYDFHRVVDDLKLKESL